MPILDLTDAKPLEGYRSRRDGKRTLDVGALPSSLTGGFGLATAGGFAAAKVNRLTMDFLAASRSADQDLFGDNIKLRARARKLAVDNFSARKFLQMVVQNVVGPAGILLQAKVVNQHGAATAETKRINQRIEEEWNRWCKPGRCTADGRFSFVDLQHLAIKNCAREGENFVKFVYGRAYNDAAIALQPLDNDQCDDNLMTPLQNGAVRMGVEVTQYRRPVAYHLWTDHPYDSFGGGRTRVRVPASEIVHTAIWERPGQTRGYTWMAAAILAMNQYERYEEAAVVAARASAAKFMVVKQETAEGWTGDDEDASGSDTGADGTQLMTANAGEAMVLDPGQDAQYIDPRFPTNTHKDFTQTMLRNVATGLLVSYPSLANDLEGVNFSSIRAGLLEERDCWRLLQRWFIHHFLEPIFARWLDMALLTVLSDIALTPAQREMMAWRARGWEWVDPQKDASACILRLQNGMSTYSEELALFGRDFEETMQEREREQKFIEELGLVLGTDIRGIADTATDNKAGAAKGGSSGGN